MIPFELTARRCVHCGALTPEDAGRCTTCGEVPRGATFFYSLSISKLAVFSTITFGIYPFWWFWSQWRREGPHERLGRIAFKTVFANVSFYWLAQQVKARAEAQGLRCRYSPIVLTVLFGIVMFAPGRLRSDALLVLSTLTFGWPLIPVQLAINRVNAATSESRPARWRWWQIVIAVVLALFWLLVLIAASLPDPLTGGNNA